MKCPVCMNVELSISDRTGIEIDYCPQCRGVWLDRGELDKIIERSLGDPRMEVRRQLNAAPAAPDLADQPPRSRPSHQQPAGGFLRDHDSSDHGYRYERGHPDQRADQRTDPRYGKRRKGWLGELFDVFD